MKMKKKNIHAPFPKRNGKKKFSKKKKKKKKKNNELASAFFAFLFVKSHRKSVGRGGVGSGLLLTVLNVVIQLPLGVSYLIILMLYTKGWSYPPIPYARRFFSSFSSEKKKLGTFFIPLPMLSIY